METVEVNVNELYEEAIDYLDENFTYFVTNVLNIGHPRWDGRIPTACVALPEGNEVHKFEFLFGPQFAAGLTPEQMGFVLAHETMHIILYHLTLGERFKNKEVFNIAADCVINDYLEIAGLDLIEGICRGEDVVGFDCSNSTVSDVYNLIINDEELMQKMNGGCENPDDDGQACGECDTCKANQEAGQGGGMGFVEIDSHDWMHAEDAAEKFAEALQDAGISPDDLPDDLEEILTEAQNEYKKTNMAGRGQAERDQYMREQKITMKWLELLERVNPDIFHQPGAGPKPVTSFRSPRRKLASMYPKILVPNQYTPDEGELSRKSDKKPSIVLALDTSGSIGDETANKFVNLARSIPQDKMRVHACTFTTVAMALDLDNPTWRGGGTEFSCIEGFIRSDVMPELDGKYPKAVVVVTDGHAAFYHTKPNTEQAKSWSWLLLDDYQRTNAQSNLAQHGFLGENFELLDGFVDGDVDWYGHGR